MNRIVLFLIVLLFPASLALALNDTTKYDIDIRRVKLHEDIDKLQAQVLGIDGRRDELLKITPDQDINLLVTDAFTRKVDVLQDTIEKNDSLDHRLKVKYLTGLENLLKGYLSGWSSKAFPPSLGNVLLSEYNDLMEADIGRQDIVPIVEQYPYETGDIHINTNGSAFFENPGFQNAKIILFRKLCEEHPEQILARLENFSQVPFADSLIIVAAHRDPNQFYDYAAASRTRVGQMIRRSQDSLVKAITMIANSRSGRLYFPFLEEVMQNQESVEDIRVAMTDSLAYYRLLVSTQIRHVERMHRRDTPIVRQEMSRMLERKAIEVFINRINALHDEPDALRFKILEPLSPQELYYLIVMGEDVIYTSSYKGVYNRMMERMPNASGDTLLMSVQFDRFKKFIKMAAGYNTLDAFLGSMPDSSAQRLMIAFARGLEKTGTLEEAVDVADSYGSIKTPSIKKLIDREIDKNLAMSMTGDDKRTRIIYEILKTIFDSSNDSTVDVSQKLGIPPVYKVEHKDLEAGSGKVVQLVFFYGDKDGKDSYASFMRLFSNPKEWRIVRNKEWVEIKSVTGKEVQIYANLPLDNSKGNDPDARAQEHLLQFLSSKSLQPTIVIHRGHSYHVKYTIKQLPASAKIVILGSCGGYHNLDDVLKRCPDAHIISSKEVGTHNVNEPILQSINESLRNGKDIDWIGMWNNLSTRFNNASSRERFENYIPPYKNLGALFIKAYTRAMEQ